MRGVVRVMCGAVGLVEVGIVVISPFVVISLFAVGHGRVAGSYVLVVVIGASSIFRMALIVVLKRRFRVALGRCSMHLTSLLATCEVCSVGVHVGR